MYLDDMLEDFNTFANNSPDYPCKDCEHNNTQHKTCEKYRTWYYATGVKYWEWAEQRLLKEKQV